MTIDDLKKELCDNPMVVVKFGAEWCGPCMVMAPIFDQLAEENKDVKMVSIDIDDSGDVADEFGIMNVPTMMYFKNGEFKNVVSGLQSKSAMEFQLEQLRLR